MRRRVDRFVEEALVAFAGWYVASDWLGKERDCVNLFALRFLARDVGVGAAIEQLSQIRIEGAVPQPAGYAKSAANKDLVIWSGAEDTTWDEDWKPAAVPRVVMEWKLSLGKRAVGNFDRHDSEWLVRFTDQFPKTLGYLVQVDQGGGSRTIAWARVSRGKIGRLRQIP